jgi:hypothetical protein
VVEGRGALSLAPEELDEAFVFGVLLLQYLEGDIPLEDLVVCHEYLGHASTAQGAVQSVAAAAKYLLHDGDHPIRSS